MAKKSRKKKARKKSAANHGKRPNSSLKSPTACCRAFDAVRAGTRGSPPR